MRIAMLGTRGVPATFGGIERHVEELGSRLVERGHQVTVFCRTGYVEGRPAAYRGMRLRHLPSLATKHLDAISHTSLAAAASLRGFDVVHYHAVGPGLLSPLTRSLSRAAVVQTIHALDADRAKWGPQARRVLRAAEHLSARVPHEVVVISTTLADHYTTEYSRATTVIPNGVLPPAEIQAGAIRERFGLEPQSFVLFVGRMVPEKQPHLLVEAFRRVPGATRLVLAGGSSFSDNYLRDIELAAAGDERVVLTGYVYGDVLAELYANAIAFVSPSAVEGGPPLTLLEALSHGTPIVASDIPFHLELLGDDGYGRRIFVSGDADSLAEALRRALSDGVAAREAAEELRSRVLAERTWEQVAAATERVYEAAVRRRRG